MKNLPARLYVCPMCGYSNPYRWVLSNHLQNVHGVRKNVAKEIAASNEFLANPIYRRVTGDELLEEDEE